MLMAGESALSTVTHVIVDEVHERDRLSDFLLIKLRDILQNYTDLKLIISSAALDTDLFIQYFGSCPVIHIKGRPFEVKEMFLEDILRSTGYINKKMVKYMKEKQREEEQRSALTEWCSAGENSSSPQSRRKKSVASVSEENNVLGSSGETVFDNLVEKDSGCPEPWLIEEMDLCLSNIWLHKDTDSFAQVFHLILTKNVSVDYRHSETSATALMIASGRGFTSQVEQLIRMGANIHCKSPNGWMALDWAKHFGQTEVVDLLESYGASVEFGNLTGSSLVLTSDNDLGAKDQELLKAYQYSLDDEEVDLDLIMHLLYDICNSSDEGAILIFLPGYDEIIRLRNCITFDNERFVGNAHRYQVFALHSNMQTLDQESVLKTPPGIRKIILSTNVAETSITISDVVFVIDSGKMKEKSFDALSCVTVLKTVWISKASAMQRRGRAGRCQPGVCFHLFSRIQFQNMLEFQTPELGRMPLQELCLHTKLLAPVECPVADFLKKAPNPPPAFIVTNALQMLKKIDAMDVWEDLTELGYHLAKLDVEPHLGKMVLCAIVLKCLDPVLTIASALAYRDPFVLPALASQKCAAVVYRKELAEGTFSDHMVLLRAFQAWQKAQRDGWERDFCERSFLSQAAMEIILGMRAQLLGQLRALGFIVARGGGAHIRDVNANSENWAVVKAAIVAGMYPNLVHVDRKKLILTGPKEKVQFHPTSVLSQAQYEMIPPSNGQAAALQALPTDWLVYDEMTRAHRIANIRCCSVVTPVTVALFCGPARLPPNALQETLMFFFYMFNSGNKESNDDDSDSEIEDNIYNKALLKLDEWLHFKLDPDVAGMLMQLRLKWHSLLLHRMRAPSKPWSRADEVTLSTVVSVLSTEEQLAGLLQPTGVGQKPRPVSYNALPSAPTWRSANSSAEAELFDGSSNAEKVLRKSAPPAFHQPWKSKEKNTLPSKRTSDNKSGQSSVKPVDSSCCPNPCASPSLVSGKDCETPPPRLNMPVRYFIMKCRTWQNLHASQQKGVWSTTPSNEQKLNRAFCESSLVYLIFSVQRSGCFQGFGRMSSEIKYEQNQCLGSTGLEGVFKVEWIRKESIPFYFTRHLLNPWNDNKKVQISRDGQELEPQVGEQLLQLWCHIHSAGKTFTDSVK
ncbi:3'-5' RNA helicase YTHDC2 [Cyrtonyx montezumae]|uniref:3'-5' RNA helicase YTHDC2 n=1 Tax=Cyrtonyx montezumae TaxID=9017 RepID=UPI0032D9D741